MRRVGDFLLGLGLVVGVGAIVGYELDIIPSLPPEVLKLVLYKLIFVGGVGLLVAGAFVRRLADRIQSVDVAGPPRPTLKDNSDSKLALPSPPATEVINREPATREKPPSIL